MKLKKIKETYQNGCWFKERCEDVSADADTFARIEDQDDYIRALAWLDIYARREKDRGLIPEPTGCLELVVFKLGYHLNFPRNKGKN